MKDPLAMIKMVSFWMKGKDYTYYGGRISETNIFAKKR